jgi:flagellar protein FliL
MADPAALALDPPAAQAGKGKTPGRGATIAAVAIATGLALAAGGGTGLLLANDVLPAPETVETPGTENPAAYASEGAPLALVALAPVITNIASPPSAILRVEASLVVRAEQAGDTTLLAAQVGADTLAFARSLDLAQIEGSRGLLHLREDLRERAMLRSPAVADYVIHSLIAQ